MCKDRKPENIKDNSPVSKLIQHFVFNFKLSLIKRNWCDITATRNLVFLDKSEIACTTGTPSLSVFNCFCNVQRENGF